MAFVTPIMEHWWEQEIAQWVHHEGSIQQLIASWAVLNREYLQCQIQNSTSIADSGHKLS